MNTSRATYAESLSGEEVLPWKIRFWLQSCVLVFCGLCVCGLACV